MTLAVAGDVEELCARLKSRGLVPEEAIRKLHIDSREFDAFFLV
jgi:hypothetical protein